jgi:hypothetical protein
VNPYKQIMKEQITEVIIIEDNENVEKSKSVGVDLSQLNPTHCMKSRLGFTGPAIMAVILVVSIFFVH